MTLLVFDEAISQEDAQRIKDVFRHVGQLPDRLRRQVIATLAAHYIDGTEGAGGSMEP